MYIDIGAAMSFLCVFSRMSGAVLLNPVFGRQSVPVGLRIGLAFFVSVLVGGGVDIPAADSLNLLEFALMMLREFAVGMVMGFVIQLFLGALIVAGEAVDMQMGLSMAKAYDPGSGTSISMTSNMLTLMFMLIFFATNSHLTLIKIAALSFKAIPAGRVDIDPEIGMYITDLFSMLLLYALKMSLPMIAAQIVSEAGVGIIMKAIPQINVFIVNIQIKILIGFVVILTMVPVISNVLEHMIEIMFSNITRALEYF